MKKIRNIILSAALIAMLPAFTGGQSKVSAATKEDVIAAAKESALPEYMIKDGENYLNSNPGYTSSDYDYIISQIQSFDGNTDALIDKYLQMKSDAVVPESPSDVLPQEPVLDFDFDLEPTEPSEPSGGSVLQNPAAGTSDSNTTVQNDQNSQESRPSGGNAAGSVSNQNSTQSPQKNYSDMTPEEQKKYRETLTQSQKNQILKDLPKDQQLELINGLINASSALGMNVTVEDISNDTVSYSVRNNDGKIVDISSVGVIVDDTGFDYTALVACASAVFLFSAAGIAYIAVKQRKND